MIIQTKKIKDYRNLNGWIHHQLIFAEENRDNTPILVEYFNDLSSEQNEIGGSFVEHYPRYYLLSKYKLECVKYDNYSFMTLNVCFKFSPILSK